MKKIVILLVIVAVLVFAGCGKSEAVVAAEDAIAAIGEVTLDSGEAIDTARKLYELLTEDEKADVENRLEFVEAQEKYEAIKDEAIYSNAKDVYAQLQEVSQLCEKGMDAIYNAWHFGIYRASEFDYLAHDSSLYFYNMAQYIPGLSDDELEEAAAILGITPDKIIRDWQNSVWLIEGALALRGDYDIINENMQKAQETLQLLTDEYDDYKYYPKLKEYYSAIKSYVDFYTNPSGSFNQLADTVNDYENKIRTLASDVGFLFD